jgi:hypothetical protein
MSELPSDEKKDSYQLQIILKGSEVCKMVENAFLLLVFDVQNFLLIWVILFVSTLKHLVLTRAPHNSNTYGKYAEQETIITAFRFSINLKITCGPGSNPQN